jgi:hypothetical protein
VWPEAERTVAAGETRIWAWDQLAGGCYGACQNVAAGNQTEAGRYVVTTKAGGEAVSDNFDIGQYFTLGFDNEPDLTFVVFVANQADVDRLRTEANPTEKNLIVSGIVRGAADYNPAWSYSMGPHSIVAAEVFTEVCDQHPQQVESDRRQWRGQRWCPWSSYVDREGR